jgi:hypothetical protein
MRMGRNGEIFLAPQAGNGNGDSKWWLSPLNFTLSKLGNTHGHVWQPFILKIIELGG